MFDQQIRYAARSRPFAVALTNGQTHVTYAQLDEGVDQIAAALVRTGLPGPGAIVGVALADGYRHALVTLASARLGLATTSLLSSAAAGMARIAGVTQLIAEDPALAPAVLADAAWLEAARAAPPAPPPPVRLDPDAIARVQLSSGTTGVPKAVALTWGTVLTRNGMGMSYHGLAARTLSMIGVESGGFGVWTATWRNGGTVLVPPPSPVALAQILTILAPTMIIASPVQIAALTDALEIHGQPLLHQVLVSVAGGRVSRAVRERLALRLGATVAPTYASTEAGTVAAGISVRLADDRDVGFVMPGFTVEIVDEAGTVLPAAAVGHLRIAGPGVVSSYMDGQSTPAFRDGWFYPGDLGSLSADGMLRIVGRADEIINVGGEKVAPEALEELVKPVPGVADVAAFALAGESGDQPWLAIVRDGAVGEAEISAGIARALTIPGLGGVRIAWIEAIPRTLMGKVRREELQAAARRL